MASLRERLAAAAHVVDCGCDDMADHPDLLLDDAYREHADRALEVFAAWLRERAGQVRDRNRSGPTQAVTTWADDRARVLEAVADEIAPKPALPPEQSKGPCPEGFHWLGQSFAYCDICGLPAWEHEGMAALPSGEGPFDSGRWVLRPWNPGEREACRAKWEPTMRSEYA